MTTDWTAKDHENEAIVALAKGEYQRAADEFNNAIIKSPTHNEAKRYAMINSQILTHWVPTNG